VSDNDRSWHWIPSRIAAVLGLTSPSITPAKYPCPHAEDQFMDARDTRMGRPMRLCPEGHAGRPYSPRRPPVSGQRNSADGGTPAPRSGV
jgi:hypothetical protein